MNHDRQWISSPDGVFTVFLVLGCFVAMWYITTLAN